MSRTFAAIAALTFIFASSAASAQMLKTADTAKGKTFVDAKGASGSCYPAAPRRGSASTASAVGASLSVGAIRASSRCCSAGER